MRTVRYHVPTRIFFGSGIIADLKTIIDKEIPSASSVYLVTDQGIKKSGIADRVIRQLETVTVFDEIEQNPRQTTIDRAGKNIRNTGPDLVIGVGGGSVLDSAKAIALLATNPGRIEDYEGRAKYVHSPLPVLAIPTTCGTGSEVTWVAVITHTERHFKMSIKGPEMYPAAAVVDPDSLSTLPPHLVASTGLDAITHAIEAFSVKPSTFLTDLFARESLKLMFKSLPKAYANIRDSAQVREEVMKGSLLAGLSFGNADVGAVHCLAEAVGSILDTPHGVANAVFLPHVMDYNLSAAESRYADIARMIGIDELDDGRAASALIRAVKDLAGSLGIPSLSEIGVRRDHFDDIARKSFENNSNPSNPRDVSYDGYISILERAFAGG
jgi:alcohol dehydrogenase